MQHRQLVAQDGNIDVLAVWCGTEADQPKDVPYEEEDDGRSHAIHTPRCPSWLLRGTILYLHPSGQDQAIGRGVAGAGDLAVQHRQW